MSSPALPQLRPALMAGVARKVDHLTCVRLGSARYSVPHALVGAQVPMATEEGEIVIRHQGREVGRHRLAAPRQVAIADELYGGARSGPARSPRPRTSTERALLALGEPAERFLIAAAAAGTPRLGSEIAEILGVKAALGRDLVVGAIERAHRFARYGATDVRAILAAGAGVAEIVAPGVPLTLALPVAPGRPLSVYAPWARP